MSNPEEEIRKLREGTIEMVCLFCVPYICAHRESPLIERLGKCKLLTGEIDKYFRTVLSDLKIDTGELTDEEIEKETDRWWEEYDKNKPPLCGYDEKPFMKAWRKKMANAARAKFVSIGEIVKEGKGENTS